MPSPAPSRFAFRAVLVLLLVLVAALGRQFLETCRHRQDLELLRTEHRLLERENRLLQQQLEAERLQSAALTRLLQGTAGRPPAPASP